MKKILLFALMLIAGTTNIFSMEAPEFTLDLSDVDDSGYDSDDAQYLGDIPAQKELASNLIENKINKLDNLLTNVTSMLKLQEDLTKKDTELTVDTQKRIDKTIRKIAKKIDFTEKALVKDELKELFDSNFQQTIRTKLELARLQSDALTTRYEQLIRKLEEKSLAQKGYDACSTGISNVLSFTIQKLKDLKTFACTKKGIITLSVICACIVVLAFVVNQYFGFVIGLTVDFAKIGNYFVWLGEQFMNAAKWLGNGAIYIGKQMIAYGKLFIEYALVKPVVYVGRKAGAFGTATHEYISKYLCEAQRRAIEKRIATLKLLNDAAAKNTINRLSLIEQLEENLKKVCCS